MTGSFQNHISSSFKDAPWTKRHIPSNPDQAFLYNNDDNKALEVRAWLSHGSTWLQNAIFKTTSPTHSSSDGRSIPLGGDQALKLKDPRDRGSRADNKIKSSRHSIYNFLPRQLFAQFSKLANFYFLCVSVLQMIPGLSTTGTFTTIIPLLFFVTLSIAKEGYDDLRRYRLDKIENQRCCTALSAKARKIGEFRRPSKDAQLDSLDEKQTWCHLAWQSIQAGDILLIRRDDWIPADMILLDSSNSDAIAYLETMALDGETNLKIKRCIPSGKGDQRDIASLLKTRVSVTVEDPNMDLYSFEGKLTTEDEELPLTNAEIMYRGSIVRNTAWIFGLVIYAGEECKIRMNNAKNVRIKAPTLQSSVNRVVGIIVAFVVALAVLNTIAYQIWQRKTEAKSWYLSNAHVAFFPILTSFIILFNTMIPLSLYVSLEIIKLCQLYLMNDFAMYNEATDTPMEAHTSTINEDLGQISHIFSDKTGTLTDNDMKFRKLSVDGFAWHHRDTDEADATDEAKEFEGQKFSTQALLTRAAREPNSVLARRTRTLLISMALCHTCVPETDASGSVEYQAVSPDEVAIVKAARKLGYEISLRDNTTIELTLKPAMATSPFVERYEILQILEFTSDRKRMTIVLKTPDDRIVAFCKGADSTMVRLLREPELALKKAQEVQYRVQERRSRDIRRAVRRADEERLRSSMSARPSFSLNRLSLGALRKSSLSRGGYGMLQGDETEGYTDFMAQDSTACQRSCQSARPSKEMSRLERDAYFTVLARSSLCHLDKDNMGNAGNTDDDLNSLEVCLSHVEQFASEGLRTLIYCHRYLSLGEYEAWAKRYQEASASLVKRKERMSNLHEELERDFTLTGAVAIEDKLQNGVPEALESLRKAGIKIWMLTGDKRETAINIGRSCRLIRELSSVSIIDVQNGDIMQQLAKVENERQTDTIAHSVLVIDGQTLAFIYEDGSFRSVFERMIVEVDTVICCRASPSQKACLVHAIRNLEKKAVTLAIGDGANDVAMIQEAHVGIGITGKEGLQAARTSDYSIAQFRFLTKLLLVHGRWNYVRTCKYTLGTFWKEMTFYLTQAFFQRFAGYTGTSLYEPWSLSMFNTLFTSLPVIFLGIFEQDIPSRTLLALPELYESMGPARAGFNIPLFLQWTSMAVAQAALIYFLMLGLYGQSVIPTDDGLYAMGALTFTACIIIIAFKMQFWVVFNKTMTCAIALILSIGGWFLWNIILSMVYTHNVIYKVKSGFVGHFGQSALWWATLITIVMSCWILEILVQLFTTTFFPSNADAARAMKNVDLDHLSPISLSALQRGKCTWHERSVEEEYQREREIQDILNRRCNTMPDQAAIEPISEPSRRPLEPNQPSQGPPRNTKVSFAIDNYQA